MTGHGLTIRKLRSGKIGCCTGQSQVPLFVRPDIQDMLETLEQLSAQTVALQKQIWTDRESENLAASVDGKTRAADGAGEWEPGRE